MTLEDEAIWINLCMKSSVALRLRLMDMVMLGNENDLLDYARMNELMQKWATGDIRTILLGVDVDETSNTTEQGS